MQVKKQQLERDMEKQTGSKSGKEYIKAIYCHPAYLIYTWSASWETLDWMKHKLESRSPGEISITSDMQTTPPLWQKVKNTKERLDEMKEESEKVGLKLNIHKTKIMTSGHITSWQIDGETMKHWQTLFFQFSSVAQSCRTLCDPMNHSMPGLPVHHQLPESTKTHVHWVGDAIQPSHPLLLPSPPALNLSQHQVFSKESALRIRWPKY